MENKKTSLIVKILVPGISILIGLFVIESGLRFVDREEKEDPARQIWVADDRGDTIHKSNLDIMRFSEESKREAHLITNAEGFMGKDYEVEKSENTIRVAMLGDSFLEAIQVDFDQNFAYLLEEKLNSSGDTKFEIMNFGVGGQGTMEELKRYPYYISKYKPDYVLLFFYPNDFENSQYYLSSRYLIQGNNPEWKNIPLENANSNFARDDFKYKLLKNFHLVRFLDAKVRQNAFLSEFAIRLGLQHAGVMGVPEEGIHPTFLIFKDPLPDAHKEVYDFTSELIVFMNSVVGEDGARLGVVYLPQAEQVDDDLWKEEKEDLPVLEKYNWNFDQPNNFLKEKMETNNISYLDLAPILRDYYEKNEDAILYYDKRRHLNEDAHVILTDILAGYIENLISK